MKNHFLNTAVLTVALFTVAFILSSCVVTIKEEPSAETSPPWLTRNHDFGRSSATDEPVELPLKLTWERNTATDYYTTPAVRGGIVYTGSTNALYAFKLSTGGFVWQRKTNEPVFGTPTVTEDKVFIGTAEGKLHCLDRATGDIIWTFQALSQVSSSPLLSGSTIYFTSADLRLHALDAATGARLWSYNRGPYRPLSTQLLSSPALYGDSIINFFPDGYVVALDGLSGKEIWQRRLSKNPLKSVKRRRTPLVDGDRVYVLNDSGSVLSLDAATGKTLVTIDAFSAVDFTVKDSRVYLLSADKVTATELDGTLAWSASLGDARGDSLFAAGEFLFTVSNFTVGTLDISFLERDMGRIEAFKLTNGERVWKMDLDDTVTLPASSSGGSVAIVSTEGTLTVLSPKGIERNLGAPEPL